MLSRFGRNESGATAIEYGLIAAVMSVAILAAFPLLRTAIETAFGAISTAMTTAK
jgi:pilus assembly protein Flp/PilA